MELPRKIDPRLDRRVPAGAEGLPVELSVRHACGCEWRWHFWKQSPSSSRLDERAVMAAGLAAVLRCPRCDGTVTGPADISYWPTGICHAHDGPCPDNEHGAWLDAMGVRFRPDQLVLPR